MDRGSGVLLHITSLPGPYGIGDLGPEAYRFADFLAQTKQKYWQILPLTPTEPSLNNSPYSSSSAFAGNKLLISPDLLFKDGFLENDDYKLVNIENNHCSYQEALIYKDKIFEDAYNHFKLRENREEFDDFCKGNNSWLESFALYITLKKKYQGQSWNNWPVGYRDRDEELINKFAEKNRENIEREKFIQYLFFHQWQKLRKYCNDLGVRIIGDIPIYVCFDSVDVWYQPELFKLNENKEPEVVAGVPPDYFSKTGQLWGNPIYNWEYLRTSSFEWWVDRMSHNNNMYDYVRVDHFRGLVAYWEIVADEKTAVSGQWVDVPVLELLDTILSKLSNIKIIAEDLGVITDDVKDIMSSYNFPGMKVLQFAFDEDAFSDYLPHNYQKNCLVYTGTHDNNTSLGWFKYDLKSKSKEYLNKYLGKKVYADNISWELIQLAISSAANVSIIPMQDILNLDAEARMNEPSTLAGNWQWRFTFDDLTVEKNNKLLNLTEIYGRG